MPNAPKSAYYQALIRLKPLSMTEAGWARAAKVSSSFFQDLKKKDTKPRLETVLKLLGAVNATLPQFNALLTGVDGYEPEAETSIPSTNVREADIPYRHRSNPTDVPIYGTAEGAQLFIDQREIETTTMMPDEVVDYIRRPIGIAERRSVYALFVVGTSMEPRWMDGEPIFVDPNRTPAIGDHVVAQLVRHNPDGGQEIVRAMVKRLVRRTAEYYELQQYNPDLTFRIPKTDVRDLHRVIPPNELHGI